MTHSDRLALRLRALWEHLQHQPLTHADSQDMNTILEAAAALATPVPGAVSNEMVERLSTLTDRIRWSYVGNERYPRIALNKASVETIADELDDIRAALEAAVQSPPIVGVRRLDVFQAIYDPGILAGPKGDRSLTQWQTDAVCAALSSLAPVEAAATEPVAELSLDEIVHQHPDVGGSDEETERLLAPLKPTPPHNVYGPFIPLARAIVHEYLEDFDNVRKETGITDVWDTAEYMLRVRIASALALAHPSGDSGALREALAVLCDAVMADIKEAKSRLDADIEKDAPVHPVSAFLTGTAIHVGKARAALSKGEPGK